MTSGAAGVIKTFREAPSPVRILIFGMLVNRLGAFLPFFLIIFMVQSGYNAGQAGLALGAYGIGGIVGGIAGGWLTDRLGCQRTIVVSSAGAALLNVLIFYAPTLPLIMVTVGLVGILSYAYRPASSALLAELVPPSRYTMIFAMYRLAMSLGTAGGPLIGAGLITYGFGPLFWVEGAVLLIFAAVAAFALPRTKVVSAKPQEKGQSSELLRDYRFVLFLTSVFVVSVVYFQHLSTLPLQVVTTGLSTGIYASLITINALVVTLFELPLTKIVQHWPPRTALILNYTFIGAGMALYAFPWGVAGLYIATLVWSLGEIIGAPTFFSYPARIAPEGLRGRYLGASGAMMSLAFAIGPAVGTPLWSAMGSSFWLVCGLVCAVAVAAVYVGVLPSDRLPVAESENAVPADQKTLLLVASSANPDLLKTPRDLGLSIVIAAKNPPANSDLYDVHLNVDEMSEEAVAQAVSEFVASGRRIDAVACFHEGSLRAAARVAADLGLPGNTPEAVMNMRDKAQTIAVLNAAGIGCPRSRLVTSADEAVAAAEEFGLPVVVKPQSSASSQGVTKAKDEGAVRHAYEMVAGIHKRTEFRQGQYAVRNISTVYMDPERRGVLVQELLSGPEFALDFVYANGEFFLLGIHDKPSEWEGDAFIETVYITPSGLDSSQQQLIVDTAVRGLRAVGATTGGAHVEIRLTEDGPKIIEINGRLGGTTAYVQESIQASTGVWGPREYLRAVLGERPQVAPAKENAGFVALLAERTGRIAGFRGATEVLAIPGVKGIRWLSKPGDDVVIEYPANPVSCFALALATGQTREEVLKALAQAEQTLVPVME